MGDCASCAGSADFGRMSAAIRNHLRQNVYGMVAIFIALSGTASAVDGPNPGTNAVGSEDIINGEVKTADIGGGVVTGAKVLDDSLGNVDLKSGSVRTSEVANGSLTGGDILPETLTQDNLGTDSVRADEIRYWSVGSDELVLSAVGDAHIRPDAVRSEEIQEDAVGSSEIVPDSVGEIELKGPLIVEGPPERVNNDDVFYNVAYASCPANYQLLSGGGVRDETYGTPSVSEDRPVGDSWAWGIRVPSDDVNTYTIRAYAVCMAP